MQARSLQPCVMYLEEFESVAHMASDTAARIVNQMAMCLDEIQCGEKVFVMAATNRPDLIEPVLLRPGRFDQLIYVPLPNMAGRQEILSMTLAKAPLHTDVRHPFDPIFFDHFVSGSRRPARGKDGWAQWSRYSRGVQARVETASPAPA